VYANSGLPLTVTGGRSIDPAGLGLLDGNSFAGRRPNLISNPNSGAPHTFDEWFNIAAFADPPNAAGPPGDAPRSSVRGPGLQRWDISLFKNTKVGEHVSTQFRAEAFNIFNHTNFDGVRTTLQSGTFGRIISTRDPRILQLALKLYFWVRFVRVPLCEKKHERPRHPRGRSLIWKRHIMRGVKSFVLTVRLSSLRTSSRVTVHE